MLPEMPPELDEAQAMGISFFAGEAEGGRLDQVLRDAWAGRLQPLYDHMDDLPGLDGEPAPILPKTHIRRTAGVQSSIDLGRGCPYQCSFCTIINVQGRKSRYRTPDDLERCIREHGDQDIYSFFVTDDNFARNRNWEPLVDRIIELNEGAARPVSFTIQVDTLCHRIPNFIEKVTQAGARRVFIGLENINPDNLLAAKKNQNKITEYRAMLQKWRDHGALTYAGYILGFPGDTKESILRDIEIIKRELPLDLLEFFFLTPLPGSEDHKNQFAQGVWMDPDLNKYDVNHRVSHHPKMTDAEWEAAYRAAWEAYYTPEHVRTILRRVAANPRGRLGNTLSTLLWFKAISSFEGVHPLEGGVVRLKHRRDRRPGLTRESIFRFYSRYAAETATKAWSYWRLYREWRTIRREVAAAPDRWTYTDVAITPVAEGDSDTLSLYRETNGGEGALARQRRHEAIRARALTSVTQPAVLDIASA